MSVFDNMNPNELNARIAHGHKPSLEELKAAVERNTKAQLFQHRTIPADGLVMSGMSLMGLAFNVCPTARRQQVLMMSDETIAGILAFAGTRLVEMGVYKHEHPDAGQEPPPGDQP